nr:ComEC/Rec2 family competence protein [Aquimarina litoralis]
MLNVPFVILTFSLCIGIIIGYYIPIPLKLAIVFQVSCIIGLSISWLYAKKVFSNTAHFSGVTILTFIVFGITLVQVYHPKNNPHHFIHHLNNTQKNKVIEFSVKKRLKPTSFYEKYVISLHSYENKRVTGDVLLRLPKDSTKSKLITGTSYIAYSKLQPIPMPLNPNQFNYATYMSHEYIFYQTTINTNNLIYIDKTSFNIYRIADLIRMDIHQKLSSYSFDTIQLSIINALILGQKQDIDSNTFNDFRDAGATHILAISGLHVGILLILLNIILKPLDYVFRKSRLIKVILSILSLWSFAVIAGLSPSVLRAATMFSFVAIGTFIRSKTSIYNALVISMFILLSMNPLILFSVGFQLSYVAVFSIVWIQPHFVKIYRPKFYIDRIIWETFTVTITAQIGLLPLLLYYFHQFPLLFIVSNVIIIPILGIVLGLGILIILLAEIQLLTDWMVTIYGSLIDIITYLIHWVAKQKTFIIKDISFSFNMLITGYFLIISIILAVKNYHIKKVLTICISLTLFLLVLVYEKNINNNNEELIIFHTHHQTMIGVLQNRQFNIFSRDSIPKKTLDFLTKDYLITHNSKLISSNKLLNIYTYKNKKILILDNDGLYKLPNFQTDIIILINSPKVHLHKVIEVLQPRQIIADGSNYRSYLDRWENTCLKEKVPFHRTDKKGAFILK